MHIGPIRLDNRLILAPMAGVTDRPFRQLCRRLGAGLAVSEMVSADTGLWRTRKTRARLDHSGEAGPISVQIVGADPAAMAEAARVNRALGADIIDINMGCPAKKVCKVAAGSALLRDEALVARILEAVVAAVDVPVTLKIRTGWAPGERNALRIARIARESGIAALAVHGRTRACGFAGQAEYETLRQIKAEVALPLIANGDIDSPEKAARRAELHRRRCYYARACRPGPPLDLPGGGALPDHRRPTPRPTRGLDPRDPVDPPRWALRSLWYSRRGTHCAQAHRLVLREPSAGVPFAGVHQ